MAKSESLKKHWWPVYLTIITVVIYNIVCHVYGKDIQLFWPEDQRIFIRTILYIIAILLLPLANLMRFILIRLNQTMPGNKPAEARYFTTIVITQLMVEIIAIFGIVMFILGDGYNTLYIFSLLTLLGAALHRPKPEDLSSIEYALSVRDH
jgi:hypothetical protein